MTQPALTDFQTEVWSGDFVHALTENERLPESYIDYRGSRGNPAIMNPNIPHYTPTSVEPGTGALGVPGTTRTSGICIIDPLPVFTFDRITYTDMEQYAPGERLPPETAQQLAAELQQKRMNLWMSALAGGAIDGNMIQSFKHSDTSGKAIFHAITGALKQLAQNKVQPYNRHCILDWASFYALREYAPSSSRDFQVDPNNRDNSIAGEQGFGLFRMIIQPAVTIFDLDLSTDSGYSTHPTKYKRNFTSASNGDPLYGVVFQQDALQVNETQPPTADIWNSPDYQGYLTTARAHFGTLVKRTGWAVALVDDGVTV